MSAFMSSRYAGLLVSAANGTSMSSWIDRDQPDLSGQRQHAVERRIEQARRAAGNLVGNEFLVDRELADSREHAGKGPQHSPNLIGGVHVARIEPVIIGSNRACRLGESDRYSIAIARR